LARHRRRVDGEEIDVEAIDPNNLDPYRLVALGQFGRDTERLAHNLPRDFVKGAFMLTSSDLAAIVRGIMEVTEEFFGDDPRWAVYLQRIQALPL
jgi:hypothetical protein